MLCYRVLNMLNKHTGILSRVNGKKTNSRSLVFSLNPTMNSLTFLFPLLRLVRTFHYQFLFFKLINWFLFENSQQTTLGGCLPISTRSVLDHHEMAYVKVVIEYNDQVLRGGIKPSFADRFSDAAKAMNDQV